MTRPTRKLTTILAADVVGFSKLMDQHEELTLKNLKTCRDIVDPIITEYGGRIFHTAGDSVIAEFASWQIRQSPNLLPCERSCRHIQ